jgi:hypothetical protein
VTCGSLCCVSTDNEEKGGKEVGGGVYLMGHSVLRGVNRLRGTGKAEREERRDERREDGLHS